MPDANLNIRVDSKDVTSASKSLKRLDGASSKAERSTKGLTSATKKQSGAMRKGGASAAFMAVKVAGLAAAALSVKKLFSSTVDIQNYRAQLKTTTGGVQEAAEAFEALEDFASSTPYALEQTLQAFNTLTNLGLTPSERALQSYGNTAAAMGKDMTQLIEAVADAATGEFERLKEFGIKAKSEGDKVSLTFRGMTTTIGKNAAEIEEYLTKLGEKRVCGGNG